MFDLFYTLFKYKEKAQKDELGYYPEKVDVRAFPERRYLWTSRFFVIVSCLSLCMNMILGGALCLLVPQKYVKVMPLQIDYNRYEVTAMEAQEKRAYAGELAVESLMAQYITARYTIGDNIEELNKRMGEKDFLYLASDTEVYNEFNNTERPYFESLQRQGVRRQVDITMIYQVSANFWQVRFKTIDTKQDGEEPIVSSWIATIRMHMNFSKYEDKNLGLINPFGMTVTSYNISYVGNNVKNSLTK